VFSGWETVPQISTSLMSASQWLIVMLVMSSYSNWGRGMRGVAEILYRYCVNMHRIMFWKNSNGVLYTLEKEN